MKIRIFCLIAMLFWGGCERHPVRITSPSQNVSLPAWYPCVVVHSPGGISQPIQFQEIEKLQRTGAMTWIRLNATIDGRDLPYHDFARSTGLHVFSIITLEDLEKAGWENAFDRIHEQYQSDIYEIAGEITNTDPSVNPTGTTTPEYYIPKLRALYDYVQDRYPDVRLASAPPVGSSGGPAQLQQFIDLGMLEMDGLIIAMNIYSDWVVSQYADVINHNAGRMRQHQIWVTETGIADPALQLDWVLHVNPLIQRTLRPEMVCHYVLWDGDNGPNSGFGMIGGVLQPPLVEGLLFKALAREAN